MSEPKERPILFSGPMVRAILDGCKTQTRRVVKSPATNMQERGMECIKYRPPGDKWYGDHVWSMRNRDGAWCDYSQEKFIAKCPYGRPGDRLWVRETFNNRMSSKPVYNADSPDWTYGWQPSIHMPRSASRITLEVTKIRVERLQDISEEDAKAEGVQGQVKRGIDICKALGAAIPGCPHRIAFKSLWDSINSKRGFSWEANPWVRVIEFRRIDHQS